MALLGVALPNLHGNQVALDLYPLSSSKKKGRGMGSPQFEEFLLVKLPILDQRNLWEAFQRLLQITQAGCWDAGLRQELLDLTFSTITPPRNRFLYKAHFWPLSDLTSDLDPADFRELYGEEMDSEDPGFLLRLCFAVYRLFEQLMINLATYSKAVKTQFDGSRFLLDSGQPELTSYAIFVAQVSTATGSI
ncbi:MAG TPA: hypothetical protein DC047_19340 [Blastocatellia bacterium]|nr:hypothetical protein [Blastocatellia bacterium]